MMAISKTETELRTTTGVTPASKEQRQGFLARLVAKVDGVSADAWEGLSKGAQEWANEAAAAHKASKPIPDFPDREEAANKEDEQVDKSKGAKKKAAGVKSGGKQEATKAAGKSKAAPAKSNTKEAAAGGTAATLPEDGMKFRIKKAILGKRDISTEDLVDKLSKGGQKVSRVTIAAVRAEFRHSLKVLEQHGIKI